MSIEIIMPAMEMAQDTGTLVEWLKREGEYVNKGEPLMAIETDKVNVEIESPGAGILVNVRAKAGDKIPVGQVIAELIPQQDLSGFQKPDRSIPSTPVAERLAKELGVDLSKIQATNNRIQKADVLAFAQTQQTQESFQPRLRAATPQARRFALAQQIDLEQVNGSGPRGAVRLRDIQKIIQTQPKTIAPEASAPEEFTRVPLTAMRQRIAERLQTSYQTAPHINLTISIEMSEVQRMMAQLDPIIQEQAGHALTLTTVLTKLVADVLAKHPRLNAHLIEGEIREYHAVHIGIAVALADGLIVPVVKNIQHKGLAAIQSEISDLAARARLGNLKPAEVRGSTFTISNLGMFEIEQFTAILNLPEVGILSVGVIEDVPRNVNGQIALRPVMHLTLNADHRAVDGAVAAQFLQALKRVLEQPYLVLA